MDCDDDANKQLCAAQGVQGFPTLKTFRPGKKPGSPVVEDYNGPRTATSITEGVVKAINNHVTKVTDKDLDSFLAKDGPKALLFTEKGTTSALLKSIAIDYLSVLNVGQVRNKEVGAVEKFGIEKFPTLVLIPEGTDAEPKIYNGELNKPDMMAFLKQAGEPNPDPAPPKNKKSKTSTKPAEESATPVAEPEPVKDAPEEPVAPAIIPINTIISFDQLAEQCLRPKAHTCLLAYVPAGSSETGDKAIASLSDLNTKYIRGKRHAFPMYTVPADVENTSVVREALALKEDVEIVAINVRRKWWRQYEGDFSVESIEAWLDAIRLGEGQKNKLPEAIVVQEEEEASSTPEASGEEKIKHEEL